jgi:hypothetical protein
MFGALDEKSIEGSLARSAHGKNYGDEIVGPSRGSPRVHRLLNFFSLENFLNKFFSESRLENVNLAKVNLLCVMLTLAGKVGKTCCERTMEGAGIGSTII